MACSIIKTFQTFIQLFQHSHFSFQKAFKQIAATIKLCFVGLSTFVVEFVIVFGSFCCFFYFVLNTKLRNFYDVIHTVENTIAMSIGKFNFGSLRAASELAAWIFFGFSSKKKYRVSQKKMIAYKQLDQNINKHYSGTAGIR